jgi:hypothetical protein
MKRPTDYLPHSFSIEPKESEALTVEFVQFCFSRTSLYSMGLPTPLFRRISRGVELQISEFPALDVGTNPWALPDSLGIGIRR